MTAPLRDRTAQCAGERSGHILFEARWLGGDDALSAGARLLEVLTQDHESSDRVLAALPGGIATPELTIPRAEGEAACILARLLPLAARAGPAAALLNPV